MMSWLVLMTNGFVRSHAIPSHAVWSHALYITCCLVTWCHDHMFFVSYLCQWDIFCVSFLFLGQVQVSLLCETCFTIFFRLSPSFRFYLPFWWLYLLMYFDFKLFDNNLHHFDLIVIRNLQVVHWWPSWIYDLYSLNSVIQCDLRDQFRPSQIACIIALHPILCTVWLRDYFKSS